MASRPSAPPASAAKRARTTRGPTTASPSVAAGRFERRVDGIDYGALDRLVGYALRRAQLAIYDDFEAHLAPLDITPQRFSALTVIERNDAIPQVHLGRVLGIARSGVHALVGALEARGWVGRDRHATDARQWRVSLTDEGRRHLDRARRRVLAHDARIGRRLDDPQRRLLLDLLERLGPG